MNEAKTYRCIHPATVEAVRFGGSSAHITAVQRWLDGEGYVEPKLTTRDLRVMRLTDTVAATPGDWITRDADGNLDVYPDDLFRSTFAAVDE